MCTMNNDGKLIYESPDGGKTIYAREHGSSDRQLVHVDPAWGKERELTERWKKLKGAVFMDDPTINDAISKVEMLYVLKKKS